VAPDRGGGRLRREFSQITATPPPRVEGRPPWWDRGLAAGSGLLGIFAWFSLRAGGAGRATGGRHGGRHSSHTDRATGAVCGFDPFQARRER